ncbi:DUF2442 domain-containing protein [Rubrolithibacter danxiaensis]|uniref:DUF2442 domain-containing protein n=1 Tax=Rubrolithibacter danxiaensis TaxID=3390805 RepID=UPI003BF79378
MSTLIAKKEEKAIDVWFTDSLLYVLLADGREIGTPLAWFPTLFHASEKERKNWRLIGQGIGIHWPDLDEDLSIAGLL